MHRNNLGNDKFISRIREIILENISNEHFGVEGLSKKSGLPSREINQRLLEIKGIHINQYIREVRLQKSLELLTDGNVNASEVAYKVGFSSPSYFSKCFHDHFGYPPGKLKREDLPVHETEKSIMARWWQKLMPKKIFLILLAIPLIIIFFGIWTYFLHYKDNFVQSGDKIPLVVLPFQNLTNDSSLLFWQEGIQINLIGKLAETSDFRVKQFETVKGFLKGKGITNYSSITPVIATSVSKKLDAAVVVFGNLFKDGDRLSISTHLINSGNNEVIGAFQLNGKPENMLKLIDTLAYKISEKLLRSKIEESGFAPFQEKFVSAPGSAEAYRYFIQGQEAWFKNDYPAAIDLYKMALSIDSNLIGAMAKIATACYNQALYEREDLLKEGKYWITKYCSKKDLMTNEEKIWADFIYAKFFGTPHDRIRCMEQLKYLDEELPLIYFNTGDAYLDLEEYEKAVAEFEKAFRIFDKWGIDPFWSAFYCELGIAYQKTGQLKKELKLYKQAEKKMPGEPELLDQWTYLCFSLGDTISAKRYLDKFIYSRRELEWSEAHIASYLGYIYNMAKMPDKAEQYYWKALQFEPQNPVRINKLAYFLINSERNVTEGMELADKALALNPECKSCMHTKGWGLFKQGKYAEAFEYLQKSWNLQMQQSVYSHTLFTHLEMAELKVKS